MIELTKEGFKVKPNSKINLPGIFLTYTQAERALEKYKATGRAAAALQETKKTKGS